MAALNSLAYLVYSILTLAAHHKPTSHLFLNVEPDDLSRAKIYWPAEQDPDLPRVDPDESIWAEQDPDFSKVDPDEDIVKYSHQIDPDEKAFAEQDIDTRRVDPDEAVWAEQDPDIPNIEPDDKDWAEQDPDIPTGLLRYGGCPSNKACTEYCKKRGKIIGSCQGYQRMECLCHDHW